MLTSVTTSSLTSSLRIFTVSGSTLHRRLALSEWMLAAAFPPLLWCMVMRLTRSRLTAALTVLLITLSGGVGLWYFLVDVRNDGWGIVTSLPQTYARMPDVTCGSTTRSPPRCTRSAAR